MSPLLTQSTIFLQPEFTDELGISEPLWIGGAISSAFHEETLRLFEDATTTFDCPPAFPSHHLLPSFEDEDLGPPFTQSGDGERANFTGFTEDACGISSNIQLEDLLDPVYRATYRDMFCTESVVHAPADITTMCQTPAPATNSLSGALAPVPSTPVDPSSTTVYAPYFDYAPQSSHSDNTTTASPPPTSPTVSTDSFGSSESDGDGDYDPPSDDNDEYRLTKSTSYQKQKKQGATSESESPRRAAFSSPGSTSSEPTRGAGRSHPYNHKGRSRNFQSQDAVLLTDGGSGFQCPVLGCKHAQKNQRVPDLKRHIVTHNRWREPEKWICCGVGMDRAHLYRTGITQGMTNEERIQAGAYVYRDRLMIGGCMKTFARRDALKRHVDNPNIQCIGHMGSYYF